MSAGTAIRAGAPPVRAVLLVVGAGLAAVPLAVALPLRMLLLAPVAAGLVALAYARPPWAAYLLLTLTPLTAGIARGSYVPVLRPHEALGLLVGTGVALRAVAGLRTGHPIRPRLTAIDLTILAMAATSSVLPLLWMAARGLSPTTEDLLYASTIWKFYGLFVLVRACVRTERQVRRCLLLSLAAYALVAVVTMLQSLQVGGVPRLISLVYATDDPVGPAAGRGTATLGSSIAIGDVMAISLAICLVWLLRERGHRVLLGSLAVLFAFGGLASGQFSGLFALGIVVVTVAVVTGHLRQLLVAMVPTALIGAFVMRPVLEKRLADFDISTGLPQSWLVRFDNLRLFVWPEVFSGQNWLFGVRPSSHIRVDVSWGPYIYIESGHLWLLWTGGIPFLVAFVMFTWVAVRGTATVARTRRGPVGVAATAALAGLAVVFVLMAFDPHLTMRGIADLLFALLAMATAAPAPTPAGDRHAVDPLTRPAPFALADRRGTVHAGR
jgi:hypothetical protein